MDDASLPDVHDMERNAPYPDKLGTKEYDAELHRLHIELAKLQRWVRDEGQRLVVIFEGRDAAGKGGAIARFNENLNPRETRIVALPKPNDTERGQWYFQRYVAHLPTAGEIVCFDRSWYNRAGVEIVMGFCTTAQYQEFFRQVPGFERGLVESGIALHKLWFTVSSDEQRKRIERRRKDPLKQWKLSPMDDEAMRRFTDYSQARDRMLLGTDHPHAPWTIINSNEKKRARLESIRHVLAATDYADKDSTVAHAPDPMVVRPAAEAVRPIDQ
jgi:polyphosphate kinase 2